jgi:hypothetical protein
MPRVPDAGRFIRMKEQGNGKKMEMVYSYATGRFWQVPDGIVVAAGRVISRMIVNCILLAAELHANYPY